MFSGDAITRGARTALPVMHEITGGLMPFAWEA
jgi:hypothetical protein